MHLFLHPQPSSKLLPTIATHLQSHQFASSSLYNRACLPFFSCIRRSWKSKISWNIPRLKINFSESYLNASLHLSLQPSTVHPAEIQSFLPQKSNFNHQSYQVNQFLSSAFVVAAALGQLSFVPGESDDDTVWGKLLPIQLRQAGATRDVGGREQEEIVSDCWLLWTILTASAYR